MTPEDLTKLAEDIDDAGGGNTGNQWLHAAWIFSRAWVKLHAAHTALQQSKDAAYTERDRLVCVLSKLWPSHLARHPESDTTWDDDWRWIVCIHAPVGQVTWHIHDSERGWFDHLDVTEEHWDGHTTDEKYARLQAQLADRGEIIGLCPSCFCGSVTTAEDGGCECANCGHERTETDTVYVQRVSGPHP